MIDRKSFESLMISAAFIITLFSVTFANPSLTPGVWTDLTPSFIKGNGTLVCLMTFDPSNRSTLYLTGTTNNSGIIKSTDCGSSWARMGTPLSSPNYTDTTTFMDGPFQLEVDPANPLHMYCTEMAPFGGAEWGFWVTTNGGAKWVRTKGFIDAVKAGGASTDVGHMAVDPTDFNHVLVTSHYYWSDNNPNGVSGVFETKDGGNTFIVHNPVAGMSGPSKAASFLYDPALGIGNKDTWLLVEDGTGMWRTTDAGTNWTKVFTGGTPHGGTNSVYYTPQKVLYIPTFGYIQRSSDNGVTWQQAPGSPYGGFYSLASDGTKIYTGASGGNAAGSTWYSAPVSAGTPWTTYSGGPLPTDGVTTLKYDSENHIMYSCNASAGFWALKVNSSTSINAQAKSVASSNTALAKISIRTARTGITIKTPAGSFFDVKGRNIKVR